MLPQLSDSALAILRQRRQRLTETIDAPVLLWSGSRPARNFPANTYTFRANSHFLYFAGLPIPDAVIHLQNGRLTLFVDEPPPAAALWHGPHPSRDELAMAIAADAAYPLQALEPSVCGEQPLQLRRSKWAEQAQTLGVMGRSREDQCAVLDRNVFPDPNAEEDLPLVQAIVSVRLVQDELAIAQIREAAATSIAAHRAGMAATQPGKTEAQIRAAMEAVIQAAGMTTAYNSIVTLQGEVLHNEVYHHSLAAGDLLLADVGAETTLGWASDITRTWPVSGKFSAEQRAIYDVVLAAHDQAIAALQPGVEYEAVHLLACEAIAAGLVDVGILRGNPQDLVAQDAHALFFPHGIGHLLGLDVHDMEDLGDRAGYAEGRQRSDRFGLGYLRLNRPVQAGMVVTIEPGFYQVPAILNDPERRERYAEVVNWERLAMFADVRGIRIEDDVLVGESGPVVLTQDLPTTAAAIEALVAYE